MNSLQNYIKNSIGLSICNEETSDYFLNRAQNKKLTRDEKVTSHLGCYFLPYNPDTQKVFIVHHKKSGLWLFPGGHVDKGELPPQTLNREIEEELGVKNRVPGDVKPFLLSITPIKHNTDVCTEHLDFWFRFSTDGSEFKIDPSEFHETRWVSIAEARKLMIDPANLQALEKMEVFLK